MTRARSRVAAGAALGVLLALQSCAEDIPEHVALGPAGEGVAIAVGIPPSDGYQFVGTVTGIAAASDLSSAEAAARNDLRNKAALLGAALVTLDQDIGEPLPLRNRTRVKLTGRAYKSID